MLTFDQAVERVLKHEGGYVWNAKDPGGETQFGISKRSYPHVDIKNLTREQAKAIYYTDFWLPCGAVLSNELKFQVFDAAVNHGIGNAIRMLQRAVSVADDGHWGEISTRAYQNMPKTDAAMRFLAERLDFMRKLSTFPTFGKGWCGRIVDNIRYAAEDL